MTDVPGLDSVLWYGEVINFTELGRLECSVCLGPTTQIGRAHV